MFEYHIGYITDVCIIQEVSRSWYCKKWPVDYPDHSNTSKISVQSCSAPRDASQTLGLQYQFFPTQRLHSYFICMTGSVSTWVDQIWSVPPVIPHPVDLFSPDSWCVISGGWSMVRGLYVCYIFCCPTQRLYPHSICMKGSDLAIILHAQSH